MTNESQIKETQLNETQDAASKLPIWCYGTHRTTRTIVTIYRNQSGYRTITGIKPYASIDEAEKSVRELNASRGVTYAQEKAMEHGSMFGWETKGADPATYEENEIKKEEIRHLLLNRGLMINAVIDEIIAINGYVGVGIITLGDQLKDYCYNRS